MLGAIIGDIVGSTYEVTELNKKINKEKINYEERVKILNPDVPLFDCNSFYTDDSVLTSAIADAVLNDAYFMNDFEKYLKEYGLQESNLGVDKYGRSRFGKGFCEWLNGSDFSKSFGNGCAMRISAIPMFYDSLNQIKIISHNATYPTHCHDESIKAVDAVCLAIYYAKMGKDKKFIKKVIEQKCGYDLNFNLEDLQRNYKFTSCAKDSVPQAIFCFLESNSFEDSLRKAISIGGDTDTICAIVGSIAENYYGIPNQIKEEANKYIPNYINDIIIDFYSTLYKKNNLNKHNNNYNNNNYKRRTKVNNGRKN